MADKASKADKPLYKPFKNNGSGNAKYFVYVKSPSGGKKKIGFGFKGMDDWRSGKATKEQRKSFRARMKGIKKKDGSFAYKDKNGRAYWALNYLW